jgi:predicted metalloprotease with PDZ domain
VLRFDILGKIVNRSTTRKTAMQNSTAAASAPIRYRVRPADPGAHCFEVAVTVTVPDPDGQRFALPAWIPGSYLIRDFARNVLEVEARAGEAPLAIEKIDKSTWRCPPCAGPIHLRYRVYAYELSVRGAYLDTTRAYFNGTSLLLAVVGQTDRPCALELDRPPDEALAHWRVATSMSPMDVDAAGFGAYATADYDELIDHPFEIGGLTEGAFDVGGIPHRVALTGRVLADVDRVCADLARVCEQHARMFGEAPIDRYLFMIYAARAGDGGLEHRHGCSLIVSRENLPEPGRKTPPRGYKRFLGLCSHEYFHLWNVKRIRPAAFVACDLGREAYTRLLWAFEGITSYYDDLALVRAGLISPAEYLELVAETVTAVWQAPGRRRQSLAESSFDAWIKLYKADENAPNSLISYYTKGSLVALALDLTIRRETRGARSLDDVMQALWRRYGTERAGLEEDAFERLACEATGLDLSAFFDAAVRGTQDPPLAELLATVGVRFELRVSSGTNGPSRDVYAPAAGLRLRDQGTGVLVVNVLDDSPAQAAGFAGGDEIVAVDGLRVAGAARLAETLSGTRAGETMTLHVFRRDELDVFELTLRDPPADACRLTLDDDAAPEALAARAAWLAVRD